MRWEGDKKKEKAADKQIHIYDSYVERIYIYNYIYIYIYI